MTCKSNSLTFAVFELYADGREYDTGKKFTITSKDSDNIMHSLGFYTPRERIEEAAILLSMFNKVYDFTIGLNGFQLTWDTDEAGRPMTYQSGRLHWGGPRPPAASIGGNWWRIRIVR